MDATVLLSSTDSATQSNPERDRTSKVRPLIISAAAVAALAAPTAATARIIPRQDPAKHVAGLKSTSSQSTALAAMIAAGTKYHAAANHGDEKTLVGTSRKVTAQKAVRPDDRSGPRAI
jgi:hypothetical protein